MKGFLLLLSFMTRIPMPKIDYDEEKLGKSMKFFPIVGIIVGLILLVVSIIFAFILRKLTYSATLPILIMVVILTDLITTGALHLDGLADTFDGIFSYRSKHKMLEIMKDSRLGSNGALALILYFLLKFVLLYTLVIENQGDAIFALITYPVVARFCSVVSCVSAPYARGAGMGKTFVDNTNFSGVIIAFIITVLYSLVNLLSPFILIADYMPSGSLLITSSIIILTSITISGLVAYAFSKLMTRKIGGITGDTLGALLEISSLLYLFLLLVVPSYIS